MLSEQGVATEAFSSSDCTEVSLTLMGSRGHRSGSTCRGSGRQLLLSVKSQKDLLFSTISPFYFSQSLPHYCDGDDDDNNDDNDGNIGDGDNDGGDGGDGDDGVNDGGDGGDGDDGGDGGDDVDGGGDGDDGGDGGDGDDGDDGGDGDDGRSEEHTSELQSQR